MSAMNIFLYEWKHFVRSPFKVIALLLFIAAAVSGLHNGASLFADQKAEVDKIVKKYDDNKIKNTAHYDKEKPAPDDRSWADLREPFWAIYYTGMNKLKTPSPAMVYSIGQAEQYGFYKRIDFWSSSYDSDMTQEITNPERLQVGTLDFSFSILFLLPLLLLILLYNLKSAEEEQGFLSLVEVQAGSSNKWLLSRLFFYVLLVFVVIVLLMLYGAGLTSVLSTASGEFSNMLLYTSLYLLFWTVIFAIILMFSKGILSNTLKMIGIWLVLAFIIPGAVHQWVAIKSPTNLMTELIDATRDGQNDIYDLPDSLVQEHLVAMYPSVAHSAVMKDEPKIEEAISSSRVALINDLMKKTITDVEKQNDAKNKMVSSSFLFNPISFFQNKFNLIAKTHFDDYKQYRQDIQTSVDQHIETLIYDTWDGVSVDKEKFLSYFETLGE